MGAPSGTYQYRYAKDRIDDGKIRRKCNQIKSRAEDLVDMAKKIEAVTGDLDDKSTLSVNGTTYGGYISPIAKELRDTYDIICAECDTIASKASSRRATEDSLGDQYWSWWWSRDEDEE